MSDDKYPFDIIVTEQAFMAGFPKPEFKIDFADWLMKYHDELNFTLLGFGCVTVNDVQYYEIIALCRPEGFDDAVRSMSHVDPQMFENAESPLEVIATAFVEFTKGTVENARGQKS